MNIEKHLILVKGKDKTEEISYCSYTSGKWQVKYSGNKTYSYNYANVQWLKNPTVLNPATIMLYHNNRPLSGFDKILDFGEYIRLIRSGTGYKRVYSKRELKVEQSCLSNPDAKKIIEYLRQLAEKLGITDEEERSFLHKQYENLTFVSPDSVLAQYLNPAALDPQNQDPQMPIFPFGFNLSQKAATAKALSEQISIIEGPPGTGKTQTILNIIANAVIKGKTVAVVSNNNSATANVLEKLQKSEV